MMKKSQKIIFFGNERLATGVTTTAPTLCSLIHAGYDVAAVILNNERAVSRKNRRLEIAELAAEHGIPVVYPTKLSDSIEEIKAFNADAAVLVAFGKIIPQSLIDIFPAGIVNIHPSDLPKHRGSTPIESTILNGETQTAVSLMQLSQKMDAGPVYAKQPVSVPDDIGKQDLADLLLQHGSELVIKHLPAIIDGSLQPTPQDENQASYDSLIQKSDGIIDWSKPAITLAREIRAYAEWPKTIAQIGNHTVLITEAAVVQTSGEPGQYTTSKDSLIVHCGTDSLSIKSLQPANKKEMPIQAFLLGYKL